jgi:endonuclease/exonuclease/phosphatase family metal-dependent hydrolase
MQSRNKYVLSYVLVAFVVSLTNIAFGQRITDETRVMSYNIRYLNNIDSINGWEFRKDQVTSLVKYHRVDILGVQEAVLKQINDMAERLPGFKWYGVPRVSGAAGEYTAIFYREEKYKLLDSGSFWFSETPYVKESKSWDAMFPRIASWCKFRDKKTGVEFYFFNTHFDHRGEIARQHSAIILTRQIDSITRNLPVIVTGDFNSTPNSIAFKNILESGKLKDAREVSEMPHYGPINTAFGFQVSDKAKGVRIDFIFVNNKITVSEHATITDQQDGRYYSDHLPVLAVTRISR